MRARQVLGMDGAKALLQRGAHQPGVHPLRYLGQQVMPRLLVAPSRRQFTLLVRAPR